MITINGKTFEVPPGASVSIINSKVYINGAEWGEAESPLEIKVVGDLISLTVDKCRSVEVDGNINSKLHCGGSASITGDVGGDVKAGTDVACKNIQGSAIAGTGVNCGDVGGNVQAGTSVKCGKVVGSVLAGTSIKWI